MSLESFSLPGSLTASPTKSVHGLRSDRDNDLFTDDCNAGLDPGSGAHNERLSWEASQDALPHLPSTHVAPRIEHGDKEHPKLPVMEAVTGRPGLRMSTFYSGNLGDYPRKRSRCAVFLFPDVSPGQRMEFVDETVNRVFMVYKTVSSSYGFRVKASTFFVGCEGLWIVLTSWDAQPFAKWLKVFEGLYAKEIIIPFTGRDYPGPSRSSLASVLDAFKETSIDELGGNQVFYDEGEVQSRCFRGLSALAEESFSAGHAWAEASALRLAAVQGARAKWLILAGPETRAEGLILAGPETRTETLPVASLQVEEHPAHPRWPRSRVRLSAHENQRSQQGRGPEHRDERPRAKRSGEAVLQLWLGHGQRGHRRSTEQRMPNLPDQARSFGAPDALQGALRVPRERRGIRIHRRIPSFGMHDTHLHQDPALAAPGAECPPTPLQSACVVPVRAEHDRERSSLRCHRRVEQAGFESDQLLLRQRAEEDAHVQPRRAGEFARCSARPGLLL